MLSGFGRIDLLASTRARWGLSCARWGVCHPPWPPPTRSLPTHDDQKCLQILSTAPEGKKCPQLRTDD